MREAGALDKDQGLEAVHGAEPLHLYTSSYSGCYFFAWDSTLPFSASLRALNIERLNFVSPQSAHGWNATPVSAGSLLRKTYSGHEPKRRRSTWRCWKIRR